MASPYALFSTPKVDVFQLVRTAANSDWTRPVLYLLAAPHFAFFTSVWTSLVWLAVSFGLELRFLQARRDARTAGEEWRTILMVVVLLLPWPWIAYAAVLWVKGTPAAQAAALCAMFTSAVVAAVAPQTERKYLVGSMAPPVVAAVVMLAMSYVQALPGAILPFALCSALGITVTMFGAAEAAYAANQRVRQMREELKAERDALETRVRERTAELEIAMKQAQAASLAKSQFLANMSHELRTPLNAVIGYAEILTEDLRDVGNDTGADDAGRIRQAGRHLLGLVGDVLDVARFDSNQLTLNVEEADVAEVLREAAEAVRAPLKARGVQLDIQIERMSPMLCDSARLKQAVGNILSNAVKFTPHGSVRLRAFTQIGREGETLIVQVRDTGVGIAAEDVAGLFQPFQQADGSKTRKADGAGLGLVMTRNIAQLMGGDVSVESTPGLGSTFTLRVPRRAVSETVRAIA